MTQPKPGNLKGKGRMLVVNLQSYDGSFCGDQSGFKSGKV